jgi:hypothetical protein
MNGDAIGRTPTAAAPLSTERRSSLGLIIMQFLPDLESLRFAGRYG